MQILVSDSITLSLPASSHGHMSYRGRTISLNPDSMSMPLRRLLPYGEAVRSAAEWLPFVRRCEQEGRL